MVASSPVEAIPTRGCPTAPRYLRYAISHHFFKGFSMATRYRNLPPLVEQKAPDLCWAAALESWLRATPGRAAIKRDDIPALFPNYQVGIQGLFNYLNPAHLPDVAADPRIKMYLANVTPPSIITSTIIAKYLEIGHLYLCTMNGATVGHCRVVYGVGYPDGKTEQISVMDPLFGAYRNEPLSALKKMSELKFGWPKPKTPKF